MNISWQPDLWRRQFSSYVHRRRLRWLTRNHADLLSRGRSQRVWKSIEKQLPHERKGKYKKPFVSLSLAFGSALAVFLIILQNPLSQDERWVKKGNDYDNFEIKLKTSIKIAQVYKDGHLQQLDSNDEINQGNSLVFALEWESKHDQQSLFLLYRQNYENWKVLAKDLTFSNSSSGVRTSGGYISLIAENLGKFEFGLLTQDSYDKALETGNTLNPLQRVSVNVRE